MFKILSNDWLAGFQATYVEPSNESLGYERAIAQEQLTADKKAFVDWLRQNNTGYIEYSREGVKLGLRVCPDRWQQLQKECE